MLCKHGIQRHKIVTYVTIQAEDDNNDKTM